jgi:anti-sigma-K factor RskA
MNKGHVLDQLADYLLGNLSPVEQRAVELHLSGCAVCREEREALQEAAGWLALAAPPIEPPARLKKAILRQINTPVARRTAARAGWFGRLRGWLRSASPAWLLAAAALILLLLASNLFLWGQVRQLAQQTQTPLRTVALVGSETMSEAKGLMVLTGDGRSGTLVVDGLPKLGPERQYQLWLIQDGQRTSGGVFSVDSWGYGAMVIESERPLDSFQSVGVTIEPAGGSPGPTGEKVLSGEL